MKNKIFVLIQKILPKRFLTKVMGYIALLQTNWFKNILIKKFIEVYQVDMSEALLQDYREYKSFNQFFTRQLNPKARPIASDSNHIISPVDGAISQIGTMQQMQLIQAKQHNYSLTNLLAGDNALAKQFKDGQFAVIYLSPKDYHRIHCPYTAKLVTSAYVPGQFYSVNQTTTEQVPNLFARNERLICQFQSAQLDCPFCLIMVGALIVSGIETVWHGQYGHNTKLIKHTHNNQNYKKADELGRFNIGSTVILLFPKNTMQWNANIKPQSTIKFGQSIATVKHNKNED